ncbi:hypothetical protein ASG32_09750 [Methylobacterium sp. Leaf361]|uniref:hypothetical protein n=1 Tax=Methylobacterium sp. Leaf361 TaxID=1736352 RepID=UPI0006F33F3C|nr:hypothetical protein [Methylobacterium sp. Leaf361]KQS69697.1 hypothetical protein ASG32_09750 [Methylobacterium sp. Leaf361]
MKFGVLILAGACGVLVGIVIGYVAGTRLGQAFAQLPVTDRSPAAQALRIVDRIATEHGLARDALLRAMLDQQGGRTGTARPGEEPGREPGRAPDEPAR